MNKDVITALMRVLRQQQEKQLAQKALIEALIVVVASATHSPVEELRAGVWKLAAQIRSGEPDKKEREELDALISLIERGDFSNIPGA